MERMEVVQTFVGLLFFISFFVSSVHPFPPSLPSSQVTPLRPPLPRPPP